LTNEILAGATHTLSRPELKEIQLEVGESRQSGQRIIALLKGYGFTIARRNLRYLKHGITAESGDLVFSREGFSDVGEFGADVRQVEERVSGP
jgi:ribosomal protein S18 acetylase RimI-like enzyme